MFVTCFHHCYDLFVYMTEIFVDSVTFSNSETHWNTFKSRPRILWFVCYAFQKIWEVNKRINHIGKCGFFLSEWVRYQSIVNHTPTQSMRTITHFFSRLLSAAIIFYFIFHILWFDLIEKRITTNVRGKKRQTISLWNFSTRTHTYTGFLRARKGDKMDNQVNEWVRWREREKKSSGKKLLSELLRQNVNKRKSISII